MEMSEAQSTINGIGGFKVLEAQGLLGIPILSASFFRALPEILLFEYPFFDGAFVFVRLPFLCIAVGLIFGLIQLTLPAIQGFLSRLIPTWR